MQHGVFAHIFCPIAIIERAFLSFKPSAIVGDLQEARNGTSAPTCSTPKESMYIMILPRKAFSMHKCSQGVGVGFPQAMKASLIVRYTWPNIAARAFGYVNVLSWDRQFDLAMFTYIWRTLHGFRPLPTGGKSRQIIKIDVTLVSHERPRSSQRVPFVIVSKCNNASVFLVYIPGCQPALH